MNAVKKSEGVFNISDGTSLLFRLSMEGVFVQSCGTVSTAVENTGANMCTKIDLAMY